MPAGCILPPAYYCRVVYHLHCTPFLNGEDGGCRLRAATAITEVIICRAGSAARNAGFATIAANRMSRSAQFLSAAFALAMTLPAFGQFSNPESQTTPVHNAAALHPPAGTRVAVVEFEDLECPDCARANPVLQEAVEKYHIPWVRHDFPLPFHTWSFDAAVDARWFDQHSKKLGDDFRDAVFAAQPTLHTEDDLHAFAAGFARNHQLALPIVIDPQGHLGQLVKADYALGQSIGIQHTPTIWVVTNQTSGKPFVEVVDRMRLFSMIDEAESATRNR